jgi:hypothetical protein
MQKHLATLIVCGLIIGTASHATAQGSQPTDRVYFGLNFAVESGSTDLNGSRTFTLYDEPARLDAVNKADAGPLLDLSGGYRVWRNVSVGIGFQTMSSKSDATITGSIPHPLFFNRARSFSETIPSLKRNENAVHLQFGYTFPINEKLDVMVYGGPSFFRISQDVVSTIGIGEAGAPFTSVVAQPTVTRLKESPVGGHIGADVTYKLYKFGQVGLGVGGFFRWTGASADFRVLDTDVSSDVGGTQAGFGLRIRY